MVEKRTTGNNVDRFIWKALLPGVLVVIMISISLTIIGCQEPPVIMVGVGETVVTPPDPVGVSLSGFDRGGNTSTGVHDDLYARSVIVEGEEGSAVALMTIAIINLNEEMADIIREQVEQQTGIPFENIVISATHTHSGPSAPRSEDPDSEYNRFFIEQSVQSAVQAWVNRVPGRIGIGTTQVYGVGKKRDALLQGGVHPDRETAVIKVETAAGRLMGVFFNYGAHPATLDLHNLEITEDWPYFAIRDIRQEVGEDVVVGYFQGAEGDINTGYSALHSAVGANMYGARSFEQAEWKGRIMGNSVLEVLHEIETTGDRIVQAAYGHFDFPRRTTYPWTVEEAREWEQQAREKLGEMEQRLAGNYPMNREEARQWQAQAREMAARGELDVRNQIGPRVLDSYRVDLWAAEQVVHMAEVIEALPEDPDPIRMPMQAIRLGETVFVTFPNEVYSEIGLAVKEQSPFEETVILGLAGGRGGYIPTAADHLERGYVPNGTPFAPQAEQVLIDASLELIGRISD